MSAAAARRVGFVVMAALALQIMGAPGIAATTTLVFRSGNVPNQDALTWVQGSTEARPGLHSSGLPLGHPFIVAAPSYWGDAGGGAFWLCPAPDTGGAPGGYEYFTEFTLPDDAVAAVLDVVWRGDDTVKAAVNNTRLPGNGSAPPNTPPAFLHADITAAVKKGTNRLRFLVENSLKVRNPTGVQFFATVTYARQPAGGALQLGFITLKSGHVGPDTRVWVHGVPNAQPGLPNSGLPLENPVPVNTPGYWGDLGGAAFWLSPSDDVTGPDGSYEYYLDFDLPDNVVSATLDLLWRGNDFAIPAINGHRLASQGEFRPALPPSTLHANITSSTHPGSNRLSFFVWNAPPGFSPTGVIFQAIINYSQ